MIIQKLTNVLQDIGHSGNADKKIKIAILDAFYEVGEIHRVESGNEVYFVIDTEVGSGENKSDNEN